MRPFDALTRGQLAFLALRLQAALTAAHQRGLPQVVQSVARWMFGIVCHKLQFIVSDSLTRSSG